MGNLVPRVLSYERTLGTRLESGYRSPGRPHSDIVFIFHFSIFEFNFLFFTSPFCFSVQISVLIFYVSVSVVRGGRLFEAG